MYENDNIGLSVGENVLEATHILKNTVDLVSSANYGSEQEREHLKQAITTIVEHIESSILAQIIAQHPSLEKTKYRTNEVEDRPRERSGTERKAAAHLTFKNKAAAILIRQIIFNAINLLNRGCAIHNWWSEEDAAEKYLFRLRLGHILAGPMKDILDDIFIAHPDLAIGGFETFDWATAKQNRNKRKR